MIDGVIRAGTDEWEIPVGFVPGMRVPGRFFLSDALMAILEPGAVQQAGKRRHPPRYYPVIAWDAGHPLGLWVSHWRRRCIFP